MISTDQEFLLMIDRANKNDERRHERRAGGVLGPTALGGPLGPCPPGPLPSCAFLWTYFVRCCVQACAAREPLMMCGVMFDACEVQDAPMCGMWNWILTLWGLRLFRCDAEKEKQGVYELKRTQSNFEWGVCWPNRCNRAISDDAVYHDVLLCGSAPIQGPLILWSFPYW